MTSINERIAQELNVQVAQVNAAVELFGEGATVPFVARYRKEKTGGLDDTQLRKIDERLGYLRQLEDRRATVLKSLAEQGKLTPELQRAISGANSKVELEDIYAPFKPKRRTKAQIARESGLEPLADALLSNPALDPALEARKYVNAENGVHDGDEALDGARAILIERFGENARLIGELREWLWTTGALTSQVQKGKAIEGAKFSDYFDFRQPIRELPSHRALALLRGCNEGFLGLDVDVDADPGRPHPAELKIMSAFAIANRGRPADAWLIDTVRLAWKSKHSQIADHRPAQPAQGTRRHCRNRHLQIKSQGSLAGCARRTVRDHGARSRHPDRRQSCRRGSDRKVTRYGDRLSP